METNMLSRTYSRKTVLAGLVIAIAVIAVAWQGVSRKKQQDYLAQLREDAVKDAETLKAFPADLVLDGEARLLYGDVQDTREGALWRQGFSSALPPEDLIARYKDLRQAGWSITLQTAAAQGEAVMNFIKDQSRLGVTIAAAGSGSKFNLDYYPRLAVFDQRENIPNPILPRPESEQPAPDAAAGF